MFRNNGSSRSTKIEKLLNIIKDGHWHSTKELVHRVGHTFAGAKFRLLAYGYPVERRSHPTKKHQFQYRLVEHPHA
ncbi:MAG: hypothetical protein WC526_00035 [Patescibacteria group bacterium]